MRKRWMAMAILMCATATVLATGCAKNDTANKMEQTSGTANAESDSSLEETTEATAQSENAEAADAGVASGDETVEAKEVVEDGMEPVSADQLKEGTYEVTVDSSSSMFKVTKCELTVKDGAMQAVMTMSGSGYGKLYLGKAEEAVKAEESEMIPAETAEDGSCTFTVPVEALDAGIDCSAFSKKKEKWYDREIVFRADSLSSEAYADGTVVTVESLGLADGTYTVEVSMQGGSGKVSVESPTHLTVKDGVATAEVIWSSPNYDYMKVNDVKYDRIGQVGEGDSSIFEIPIAEFDRKLAVLADTVAMSQPHEISYTLTFDSASLRQEN